MPIICSCLEREGVGGHRCPECKKFEDDVEQNVSKIREKKRGDLGKLYRCSEKKEVDSSPVIYQRREAMSVKGRAAARGSSHTTPQHNSHKRGHRSKHTSVSYREPSSDEFKRMKFKFSRTDDVDGCPSAAPRPTNLLLGLGSPTSPLHPEAPRPAPFTTPAHGYTDTINIPPHPPSTRANPPFMNPTDVNVHVETGPIIGASCFNDAIRQQLKDAQEEVRILTESNHFLLQERSRLEEIATGGADANAAMYVHVLQENEKRAREQATRINEQEQQLEDQRNAFRLRIEGLTNDLTETKINLRKTRSALQSRFTRAVTMSDLLKEYNPHGKRKWSKVANDIWDVPQVQKVLMTKAKLVYQNETYTCVAIACAIDSGRGCNLSGYQNLVNVERDKNKRRNCLLRSSSTIRNTMAVAEKMMSTKVPWKIVEGSKGQIHDGFEFDTKALFIHLVRSFGLEEQAKRGELEMAITIDGAKLDAKINHVTWGFKLTDINSRCPIRGKLIYSELKTMQSDEWAFPGKSVFEDDKKETYETTFCDQFDFVREVRNYGIPELGWLPCKIAEPQDMKAHQITLDRGGAAKRKNEFCHCCSKRSVEIDEENVCPCNLCLANERQCLHSRVIDDHYYMACQFEKRSIIHRCPTLMRILEAGLPGVSNDFRFLAVNNDGETCCDVCDTSDIDRDNSNQPVAIDFDDSSVVSDFTESGCDLTPALCDKLLESLPLKLMPPRKAYRDDCVHHKMYTDKYKKDIEMCMSVLRIPNTSTWKLRKQAVISRLYLLKQYAAAAAAAAEETEPSLSVLPPDKDLLLIVQKHMNGELDWHGLLDMCMYSADMDVGEKNDRASQIEFRTNRTKLLSTMRILGMKKEITHWEERRHMVHDVISLLHHFKHALYVVSYGDRYLQGETLSRVENCIPCLLHCKKRVIDKVVRMFLLKAQEKSTKVSKAAALRRVREMELIINDNAMGSPGNPGRYSIPVDEREGTILDITMDGKTSQKLLSKFDNTLIELLMDEEDSGCDDVDRESWVQVFGHLQNMFDTMSQHEDFSDEQLDALQECFDTFTELWITLCGRDGISNYIHLIITGHLMYYLRKWRNFYRYENEGWEHLNSSIAYYYFNRTQRGGSAGALSKEASSKILPIGLWFLRRLFWATDRDQLTEEVRLEKGREIREEKKEEQKLAAMSSQEGEEEESEIDCFSDEADDDADDETGGV